MDKYLFSIEYSENRGKEKSILFGLYFITLIIMFFLIKDINVRVMMLLINVIPIMFLFFYIRGMFVKYDVYEDRIVKRFIPYVPFSSSKIFIFRDIIFQLEYCDVTEGRFIIGLQIFNKFGKLLVKINENNSKGVSKLVNILEEQGNKIIFKENTKMKKFLESIYKDNPLP